MKKSFITILKLVAGIVSIIIPFKVFQLLGDNLIIIHNYDKLKWVALIICAIGFYISGLINRKTPLKFIPFLFLSLLLFYPMRCFYFPLIVFLFLFATISLFITRKEFHKKYKISSLLFMVGLFIYFLFSQPLIIREGRNINEDFDGNLINGKVIWNFSKEKNHQFPNDIFLDTDNNEVKLQAFKNKTIYVSFWATWCKPCLLQKPELEKLKSHFKDNSDIIFIDIILDDSKPNWQKYIDYNKPQGLQLRSKNPAKTRKLLKISGIPAHFIISPKGKFKALGPIPLAYDLLSNSIKLDEFINSKPEDISKFKTVDYARSEYAGNEYYTTDGKNRLLEAQINNILDTIRKRENPKFVYLVIKGTKQDNDSIIHEVSIRLSDVKIKLEE
ncbi:MAG: TlpA family protein disulfide reductase [Prolixibacteraceae bacterium]|jgi:thiol-disulfide isomerase/thioredoxin|nr:TlpA family protein disulfide reductase [Prolixibacteraceae bacterium]